MKTFITTAHEEEYSEINKGRTLGVLLNFNEKNERIDSLVYIYNKGTYIFFNTIMEMNSYLLYGDYSNTMRAYMTEKDFDEYYDAPYISEKFADHLTWLK